MCALQMTFCTLKNIQMNKTKLTNAMTGSEHRLVAIKHANKTIVQKIANFDHFGGKIQFDVDVDFPNFQRDVNNVIFLEANKCKQESDASLSQNGSLFQKIMNGFRIGLYIF